MTKVTLVPNTEKGCKRVMIPSGDGDLHQVGELFENTFVTKRNPEKHVMRQWNAYGITADVINSGFFEVIVFQEPVDQFMITLEDFRRESRLEHIEGGVPQYFIPRDKLQKL